MSDDFNDNNQGDTLKEQIKMYIIRHKRVFQVVGVRFFHTSTIM